MATGGKLKLEEGTGGGDHVGFKAPDTEVDAEVIWTLPDTDGATGQVMAIDGAKTLDWVTPALSSELDAEITARTDADATLQANIDAEETARSLADTTLQANIDAETTARAAGDPSVTTVSDTATNVDALFPITHGLGEVPEISLKVSDGTNYEYHPHGTYCKSSTTQIISTGTTLAAQLGGSTNVILRYWKF